MVRHLQDVTADQASMVGEDPAAVAAIPAMVGALQGNHGRDAAVLRDPIAALCPLTANITLLLSSPRC